MRRFSTVSCSAIVLAGAVFAASNSGCTINPLSTSDTDGGAKQEASSNDGTSSDGDDTSSPSTNGGDTTAQGGSKVGFQPSNVPVDQIDGSKVGDVAVSGSCTISSDEDDFSCGEGKAAFTLFTQPDASRVGMYVVKSFRVEANAILEVEGKLPIVIVALDKMEILGTVRVNAEGSSRTPGGFISDAANAKGGGPGGGGGGSEVNGGGGGSYCGVGGTGSALANGTAASGGKSYGTPEISPLVGGSAGGSADVPNFGGSGGGAIQFVAGTTFLLSSTGVVHAGGGAGNASQRGAGGGAGGAILIEADSATILGTLAANGGGGGGGWGDTTWSDTTDGNDATPDDAPAFGGKSKDGTSIGGDGAAADTINGGNGTHTGKAYPAGGGGGAGRIRINTKSGAAKIEGTVSPSANTPCFTQGKLAN